MTGETSTDTATSFVAYEPETDDYTVVDAPSLSDRPTWRDTSSDDAEERTPATECPGSTRVARALPRSASVWPHVDALARARAHGLALFVAEAWTTDSAPPVVAYMAGFLERLESALNAMKVLWANACEPRTLALFEVEGAASRAVQKAYAWCGALLGEFEELAGDTGVMEGRESAFARSRAHASALELTAFVRPAFDELRQALTQLVAADDPPHIIEKDVDAVERALGELLTALDVFVPEKDLEREPLPPPPLAFVPDPVVFDEPLIDDLTKRPTPVASETSAVATTVGTRWSLFGLVLAMSVIVGVAVTIAR
jgi:hypothetical protein